MDEHRFELVVGEEDARELEDVFDRWEDALERRRKSGSYAELDAALAGLIHHVNKPAQWRWLTRRAVEALRLLDELWLHRTRSLDDLTVQELALVTAAEAYIEARMPARIRVPKDVHDNDAEHREHRLRVRGRQRTNGAVAVRDREIRGLVRRGLPVQRVAFDFGLSVSQVNRIVAARAEDAA